MKTTFLKRSYNPVHGQRGQLVVEYVLLILVVVAIATTMTRMLVSRGPDIGDTGILIRNWIDLIVDIANDKM